MMIMVKIRREKYLKGKIFDWQIFELAWSIITWDDMKT